MPSFEEKFGISGGIVTAVDLLKGLATLTGLHAPNIEGATGFTDTNYANKMDAAFNILKFRRCLSELATSAGKTLISFMAVAYMLEKEKAGRILFIVPNVSLVVQASEDFMDYNWRNQTNIKIQQIYSGQKIRPGRNVVIGTYQSLVKKDKEYFEQFDAVIVDEVTPKIFTPLALTEYVALSITFKNSNLVLLPLPINLKESAGLKALPSASVSCLISTSNISVN